MLTDRYGNALATTSVAARDAYVEGCDLVLAQWPGGVGAFDRALAADPEFALAHAARARTLQMAGDMPAARSAIATAKAGVPQAERDASHIEIFNLMLNGTPDAALAQVRRHVGTWPRDALIVSTAANQNGLIGMSGLAGREQHQLDFLAALAPQYDDDWWFNSHYAMALSELGDHTAARPKSNTRSPPSREMHTPRIRWRTCNTKPTMPTRPLRSSAPGSPIIRAMAACMDICIGIWR